MTMSDKQVLCLKCTVCSCLFTTETQFYKHARREHCEEVILVHQFAEKSFPVVSPADIGETEHTMKLEQCTLINRDKRNCNEMKLVVKDGCVQDNKNLQIKSENTNNKIEAKAHNDENMSFVVLNKSIKDDQPVFKICSEERHLVSLEWTDVSLSNPTAAVSELVKRHSITELTEKVVNSKKKARSNSSKAWRQYKLRNAGCDVCTLCGKAFDKLYLHYKHYHAPARYVCETCNKVFKAKCDLLVHRRIHTGERPYSCDVCGRRFAQSGQAKTHRATHFNNGGFVCHQCGKVLRSPATLASHSLTHSEEKRFVCTVCGMRFAKRIYLVTHNKTHTGEKRFKCDVCSASFVQKINLVTHTRTHTGEKPYACTACGRTYKRQQSYKRHVKMHENQVS